VGESKYCANAKVVVLSGGEPFLRPDIVELAGFFTKQLPAASLGILTNGIDTPRILAATRKIIDTYKPKQLWLGSSLDGVGSCHDTVRGRQGAFAGLQHTLEVFHKELPQIHWALNFTITPYNTSQIIPARDFAGAHDADFLAQFAVPKQVRGKFTWSDESLHQARQQILRVIDGMVNERDYPSLLEHVERFPDKGLLSRLYYWGNLYRYHRAPQRYFKKCVAGTAFAMCDPYGNLFFCPLLRGRSIGNIRKEPFDRIWMSSHAQDIRAAIRQGDCHCWLVCVLFPLLDKVLAP
jgi:MoaA/NifB/PqqE/SkfB family radical SAM enzyme